jgi:flagellar hook-associated protein FlgK
MDASTTALLITAIGGFLMGAAALVNTFIGRRHTAAMTHAQEADASQSIQEAATALVQPLTDRIAKLETRQTLLERQLQSALARVNHLTDGIRILVKQIRDHGDCPNWMPGDWKLPE